MKYGYARVSTVGQSLNDQIKQLENKGIKLTNIYTDKFTGKILERPQLQQLLKVVTTNDEIIVCKLDRLARNVQDGLDLIDRLNYQGVTLTVIQQGMSFTGDETPVQNMMKQMLLMFAEFERSQIVERTQAGKAYQKEINPDYQEGRKKKGTSAERKHVYELLQAGNSYTQVANMTNYSRSTVQRIWREFKQQESKAL